MKIIEIKKLSKTTLPPLFRRWDAPHEDDKAALRWGAGCVVYKFKRENGVVYIKGVTAE